MLVSYFLISTCCWVINALLVCRISWCAVECWFHSHFSVGRWTRMELVQTSSSTSHRVRVLFAYACVHAVLNSWWKQSMLPDSHSHNFIRYICRYDIFSYLYRRWGNTCWKVSFYYWFVMKFRFSFQFNRSPSFHSWNWREVVKFKTDKFVKKCISVLPPSPFPQVNKPTLPSRWLITRCDNCDEGHYL